MGFLILLVFGLEEWIGLGNSSHTRPTSTSSTVKLGWVVPVYVLGIIFYIFIIRLTYLRIKIRPFISWSSFHRLSISWGARSLAPELVLSFLPRSPPNDSFPGTLPQPMFSGRQFVLWVLFLCNAIWCMDLYSQCFLDTKIKDRLEPMY